MIQPLYQSNLELYLLTSDEPFDVLMSKLELVLSARVVSLLQIRRKKTPYLRLLSEVEAIKVLADTYEVPIIINDNLALAAQLNCGVHLGQNDGNLSEARALLGPRAIIGRTCHASLSFAQEAQTDGASYVAFGAYRPSSTKPNTSTANLALLRQAAHTLNVPICAIGGIQPKHAAKLSGAGVSLIAVIDSLLGGSLDAVRYKIDAWKCVV